MAHYAILDDKNIVVEVFVGKENGEGGISDWEEKYSQITNRTCKRTSYNTSGGIHKLNGEPFRKNYAGIGYTYNELRDAFIPPKPFDSWTLNESTCLWDPPTPVPEDSGTGDPPKIYFWDDFSKSWLFERPQE